MLQTPTSLDSTLLTVVLAILAVGLPILLFLAIRFFWDRSLHLGRSKELEKLIWQLHRIASAMEHQMNLTYPSVQPGAEDLKDLAYLQRPAAASAAPAQIVATPAPQASVPVAANAPTPPAAAPAINQAPAAPQQPAAAAQQPEAEQSGFPPLEPRDPNQPPRHGGVNSMFGF